MKQTTHNGKKLHYMIRDRKNIIRCIQKDCKDDHPKSLPITLSCGCIKVFNDSVLGWTSMYNVGQCKTGKHMSKADQKKIEKLTLLQNCNTTEQSRSNQNV